MPRVPEVKELKLFVDQKYETVILPIYGRPVPYHISTIKNISQSVEGDYTYLRINFFHPGATMGKGESGVQSADATYLKEVRTLHTFLLLYKFYAYFIAGYLQEHEHERAGRDISALVQSQHGVPVDQRGPAQVQDAGSRGEGEGGSR